MNRNGSRRGALAALGFFIALTGPSCGGPNPNPSVQDARAALEAALNAWREGKAPNDLAQADPPIQVVDLEWINGRKLAAFEILREEPSESDKRFRVKLTYADPTAEAETVFIVVGSSPLSVFRDEDFQRSMNMDDNPATTKPR